MKKNDLIVIEDAIYRVLAVKEEKALLIHYEAKKMPKWVGRRQISESKKYEGIIETGTSLESLTKKQRATMQKRYTYIAEALAVVEDARLRRIAIKKASMNFQISEQTVKKYFLKYLVYQDITILAPNAKEEKMLTDDEKNIRWGLNKFYYTQHKNSLRTAYRFLLRAKYYKDGQLMNPHPSFNQFYYYYKKNKNIRNARIKREGLSSYQQDYRPLLGDSVTEYAHHVGVGMFDSTVCDIHLVDESGNVVGRPILTACVDAYSRLCMGYALTFYGGVQSLEDLLVNMVSDKKEWCKKFGIQPEEWNTDKLPGVFLTDKGREYVSERFSQLTDMGITVIELPPYRPDLKGPIEKFFDLIQESYKPMLKGKGVIETDFQQRGSHDYRLDACLTIHEFEKIILHCIIHYNEKRILKNYPYTEAMLQAHVAPFSSQIFNFGLTKEGVQLLKVTKEEIHLTLLPRTIGKFTRTGLKVHKMRYQNANHTESYLKGGEVTVAYEPSDVTTVWLLEDDGTYTPFKLIAKRYQHKTLKEVEELQKQKKSLINHETAKEEENKIELMNQIETVVYTSKFRKGRKS